MKLPIYLDNHATTPVDPRVVVAMLPYLRDDFGNPSSKSHAYGWKAEAAVEKARKQVAALIGCSESEIIFTSGATESINWAIKGVMAAYPHRGDEIVSVQTEHKAVLDTCAHLERVRADRLAELQTEAPEVPSDRWSPAVLGGARVRLLEVKADGLLDLDKVRASLSERTVLLSVMWANNEIGTIQPIRELAALCKERGILFHSDAAQAIGKVPVRVDDASVDLLSLSAHKIYGPKGVGALFLRKKPRVQLQTLLDGGGQERGMRAGTLNVAGIVGLGKAAELAHQLLESESKQTALLRDQLQEQLLGSLDDVFINGTQKHRLPGNLNVSLGRLGGTALHTALRDIAVSSGSACTSGSMAPSHVLRALGVNDTLARDSLRFGIGRFTTEEEVAFAAKRVVEEVRRLRAQNPNDTLVQAGIDLGRASS